MTVPSLSTSASASQAGTASEILSLDLRDSWLGKSEETSLVGGLLCTAKPAKPAPPSSNIHRWRRFKRDSTLAIMSINADCWAKLVLGMLIKTDGLFIGPRSDHNLHMSVPLTILRTLLKLELSNPCWLGYSIKVRCICWKICRIWMRCKIYKICKLCRKCRACKIFKIGKNKPNMQNMYQPNLPNHTQPNQTTKLNQHGIVSIDF